MAIDASFYKNVSLLMQVVPASLECTKQFKKGMFDKPNTSGFIHISYYLLSIYNVKRFEKLVPWPIMNKADERKYRMEVKNYLDVLANENPDMKFPSVLMSHLLRSGGTKFSILMWKISEISLRAYIRKNYQAELLQAPNSNDNKEVIQTYFTTTNAKRDITICKLHKKMKLVSDTFKHYMQRRSSDLKKMQTAIFEVNENIKKLIPTLPICPIIATRLTDIDDKEIINLWKMSIKQNIQILLQKNSYLREIDTLGSTLNNVTLDLCVHHKYFDGNDLPKIESDLLPLCLTSNKQLVNYGLYKNGCLKLNVLLSVFNQAFKQIECYLKMNELTDISNCEQQIIQHCKIVKSMEETFQQFLIEVSDNLYNALCSSQEKPMNCTFQTDFLYSTHLEKILTSPKIDLSINEHVINDEKLLRRILATPLQGKFKHLFKRYNHSRIDSPARPIRYEFNDSIESISTKPRLPRRHSFISTRNSPNKLPVSPRYSRLFPTDDSKRNNFEDNNAASTPKKYRGNATPKKLNMQSKSNAKVINIDEAMKNIFDLSCKITDAVASLSKS